MIEEYLPIELEEQLKSRVEAFKSAGTKDTLTDLLALLSATIQDLDNKNLKNLLRINLKKVQKSLNKYFSKEKYDVLLSQLKALIWEKERIGVELDVQPDFDPAYDLWWGNNRKIIHAQSALCNKTKKINSKIIKLLDAEIRRVASGLGDDCYEKTENLKINLKNESIRIDNFYTIIRELVNIFDSGQLDDFHKYNEDFLKKHQKPIKQVLTELVKELKESTHVIIFDLYPDLERSLRKEIDAITFIPRFKEKNLVWPGPAQPKKHLIIIPTCNRPQSLKKALDDLFENIKKYNYPLAQVLVLVVDDSTNVGAITENNEIIKAFKENALPAIYISLDDQDALLAELSKFSNLRDIILRYIKNPVTRQKGFGGVRNMLTLWALLYGEDDTLITYLDDDTTLKNLSFSKSRTSLEFSHKFNFFGHLDKIFSYDQVKIVGGLVTFDLYEGPIIVFHVLRALRTFFKSAQDKNPKTTSIQSIKDEILGVDNIKRDMNLEMGLRWLSRFCKEAMNFGAYRLPCVVYDSGKPLVNLDKPNNWLGGANISVRYSVLKESVPYALTTWRGEDVAWSKMMSKIYPNGIYRANVPVGHMRTYAKRDMLAEFGEDIGYYIAEKLVDSLIPNRTANRVDIIRQLTSVKPENVLDARKGIFKKQDSKKDYAYFSYWPVLVSQISNYLNMNQWWNENQYEMSTARIREFLSVFGSKKMEADIMSFVPPPGEIEQALRQYSTLIDCWPLVVSAVMELKLRQNSLFKHQLLKSRTPSSSEGHAN